MSNLLINAQLLKAQTIGVEIEMSKIDKSKACQVVANYFNSKIEGLGSEAVHEGRHHNNWYCIGRPALNGATRKWQFMDDGSRPGDRGHIECEMVTPVLTLEDMEDLQAIVRLLREAGAKSGYHYNAGVHIHVGADIDEPNGQNAKTIRNLVNIIASHERLICDAVKVTPQRQQDWAKFVEPSFLRAINTNKPKTMNELNKLWYGRYNPYPDHYDHSRYHLLNLHAIWDKGTIEFRCFEFHNNLHAGELKSWIYLCLAMCSYAKLIKFSSPAPIDASNPKYALKNWFKNMGLIGDEFKTTRFNLSKHLTGDSACKVARSTIDDNAVLTADYIG